MRSNVGDERIDCSIFQLSGSRRGVQLSFSGKKNVGSDMRGAFSDIFESFVDGLISVNFGRRSKW